jgi:putative endonuclease
MQAGGRYAVYIMASRRNGTLYVGVTNNLALRAHQHRTGEGGEFTRKYCVTRLVWYEFHSDINEAIMREKRIKKWERQWKLELIESFNPEWADLYDVLNGWALANTRLPGSPLARG